ncbi:MAG: hypothetical protein JWQ83_1747 [Lacunisphaera sp.]|nr:hypothetical protein [Lacunisphaera sp.]MDB6166607.1 hypothetical protein [Lacunisphaera sp.]
MSLFKRILNFSKATAAPKDSRAAPRHTVGQAFPFKAVLALAAHDGDGVLIPGEDKAQDWAGRLSSLSATGASIQLHAAAIAKRGEPCKFKLSLDGYRLEIPASVAHFRCYPQHALCGFSFNFPNFAVQKSFLQVLEPVAIGASLKPVDDRAVKQDAPGLFKEQFTGHSAMLTTWRQGTLASGPLHGFDLRMNEYGVRWSEGQPELETYGLGRTEGRRKNAAVVLTKLSDAQQEEVRWLFCLAVPNLSKSVPADVRKFLGKLVA